MSTPEDFAKDLGARYREDVGWGHLEGPILVHCYAGCPWVDIHPHGRFTRWVIQSDWKPED